MVIIAWNGSGDLGAVFKADVFKKVMSIFITAAILKLAQGTENTFISSNSSRLFIYVKKICSTCPSRIFPKFCFVYWFQLTN